MASISYLTSATSTTATITIPANVLTNDVGFLVQMSTNAATIPTNVVPAGWTQINSNGNSPTRAVLAWKALTTAEAGTTLTGVSGDTTNDKILLVFRASGTIIRRSASTWNVELTAGNPSAQTATASAATDPTVVIGTSAVNDGTAAFSTQTPAFSTTVNSSARLLAAFTIYNTSPVNQTVDQLDLGTMNWLTSGYLQIYANETYPSVITIASTTATSVLKAATSTVTVASVTAANLIRDTGKVVQVTVAPAAVVVSRAIRKTIAISSTILELIAERFTAARNAYRTATVPFVSRMLGMIRASRTDAPDYPNRDTTVPADPQGGANRRITLTGYQTEE